MISYFSFLIRSYQYADNLCAGTVTQAMWYPANCVTYVDDSTQKTVSKKISCEGGGIVTFNMFSDPNCGTRIQSTSQTVTYPVCTPNPYSANIKDPSAQYVGKKQLFLCDLIWI